ncbi:unnamed protein product [Lymnaea stagnalis]|uniref:Chitin-binding type-2 domain-containing protein n=1 Tax=Lymnaea stagnalis TaxID=6523 RepID=A0AAV2IJD2_LYMST
MTLMQLLPLAKSSDSDACLGVNIGRRPHPKICQKYYQCNREVSVLKECPENGNFHPQLRKCLPPSEYNCGITTTRITTTVTTTESTTPRTTGESECLPNKLSLQQFYPPYEHFGIRYFLSRDVFTSDMEATHSCLSICSYLAEVDSKSKELIIVEIIKRRKVGFIVSGTSMPDRGVYVSHRTGKRLKYIDWAAGQPDRVNGRNCLYFAHGHSGAFNGPCDNRKSPLMFLCEKQYATLVLH